MISSGRRAQDEQAAAIVRDAGNIGAMQRTSVVGFLVLPSLARESCRTLGMVCTPRLGMGSCSDVLTRRYY